MTPGESHPSVAVAAAPDRVAASRKEEALWLLEKMVPGTGVNNLSFAFSTEWRLDLPTLRRTLDFLLDRYEILRTVFEEHGAGLTKRIMPAGSLEIALDEVEVARADVKPAVTRFVGAAFALTGRPLLRARVFRTEQGDVFCLAVHHLIFDALSSGVLLGDFSAVYIAFKRGNPLPPEVLGPVPITHDVEPTAASLEFWRKQLQNFDETEFGLWVGNEPDDDPTLIGETITRPLPPAAVEIVRRLQKELRAPEAVILLAAYYLLLAQHGAGPDMVVGSPVNSRPPTEMKAIGYHVSVVPLRLKLDVEESFAKLVRKARSTFLTSLSQADVPVDDLLLEVPRGAGSSWRNTLFQHVFNYAKGVDPSRFEQAGLKGLSVENGFSKFDLEFFILPSDTDITIRAAYHTGAFDRTEVDLLLRRYEALFLQVAEDVNRPVRELSGWSDTDRTVIGAANRTGGLPEPVNVLTAVADRCRTSPDAVAVEDGDRSVVYRDLWAAATATQQALVAAGTGTGDVVGVAAPRSPELAAAVLGVWLAGAAYLPIDPGHPEQRIAYTLANAGARAALVAPGVTLPVGPDCTVLPMQPVTAGSDEPVREFSEPDPAGCAYLIYTSGSTGKPKGTLLSHRNLANLIAHFVDELAVAPGDGVLWSTTFTFDISMLELFLPLVSGGRLVVAPDPARTDGRVLAELLRRHDVRIAQATPTSWRLVVDDAADALDGRIALCGGEALPAALARRLAHTGVDLRNVYGPTETCIWSTSGQVTTDGLDRVTVGRPLRETQVFIASPAGRELPVGVRGELCIAGAGVAIGYHERPDLNAERFGEHPDYGRYYRTGDLARWLPDGTLEVLGRGDRQIKLRGNRIELGEVEVVLAAHPEVKAAAVVLVGDPSADGVLVAWIESGAAGTEAEKEIVDSLWEHAREQLPQSSVPQEFFVIEALPTNVSQKVDYPTLTRLAAERRTESSVEVTPTEYDDELVGRLVGIWRELLGRSDVLADTNFFAHGGHSLLGAKLIQRVEEETGVSLRLANLFANPTPTALAGLVRAAGQE
ncbi:amino acid adenylation domain-containing protein [Micromonospora sp. CPCC 206060]|uniref:non-ribosomal peptide synthetase n=1 Tax=Micromonospora sp. CPCC 206060 TaxID=3122406 RepID=UPI002FF2C113